MTKKESTELAVYQQMYPALATVNISPEMVRDIAGPGGFRPSDMPRIKVPSGGGTAWELDGMDPKRELEVIVVMMTDQRLYWSKSIDEGGDKIPDCFSPDAQTGQGNPGGDCDVCALSKFGSARDGEGQACTQRKLMLVLVPEFNSPIVLSAPPTSLTPLRKFYGRILLGRSLPYHHFTTKLTLEKVDKGQNPHSVIVPAFGTELDKEVKETISKYVAETITPMREQFSKVNIAAKTAA